MENKQFYHNESIPLCLAPWHALTVNWNGNIKPDVHAKMVLGNIKEDSLDDIYKSKKFIDLTNKMKQREWPEGCQRCKDKESISGRSRRTYFWDTLPLDLRTNISFKNKLSYLDINTSNKCNLKCIHCNGEVSTSWIKDEKKLNREHVHQKEVRYQKLTEEDIDRLFNCDAIKGIDTIALRGGEPLDEPNNIYIIQKLEQLGIIGNVVLDISTNLTILNDKILNLFSKFKRVLMYVSLEGVHERYEYIRGGKNFTFADLENNIKIIKQLNNVEICYAVTLMNLNITTIPEIHEWLTTQDLSRSLVSFSNVVARPEYLRADILPNNLKKQTLEKIQNIPKELTWPKDSIDIGAGGLYDTGMSDIINILNKDSENPPLLKQLTQYLNSLDKLRNTNWKQTFPEFT
tara:strand:+ start:1292 stop:2500 length:1209 start_codon:yes stop_codon:yes gene_type:complete